MSGASPPLRSLWFGEGLTSATTEDSGRNSDATIRAPPGRLQEPTFYLHTTKRSPQREAAIVQKRGCETSSTARPRSCCGEFADVVAGEPHPRNATAGPACRRPGRPTPGRLRPAYALLTRPLYSLDAPDNTLLAHWP